MAIKIKERRITIYYQLDFVELWRDQVDEFKSICESIGRPYGYSGMNVFYFFLCVYFLVIYGGMTLRPFWKKFDPFPIVFED